MNNSIGVTNSFCGCNDNMLLILVLLMVLCPGFLGCGNDSFIIILFLLMLMPNGLNRNIC